MTAPPTENDRANMHFVMSRPLPRRRSYPPGQSECPQSKDHRFERMLLGLRLRGRRNSTFGRSYRRTCWREGASVEDGPKKQRRTWGLTMSLAAPGLCSEVAGGVPQTIVCLSREPDAGNLPVRFDEREQETEPGPTGLRRRRESFVGSHRETNPTGPVLDSTRHFTNYRRNRACE